MNAKSIFEKLDRIRDAALAKLDEKYSKKHTPSFSQDWEGAQHIGD
jgi:hypothetical protein